MRTAPKVLLCICAVVGLSAGIGTGVAVYLQPEPVPLACPDVTPIVETREVHTAALWPVPQAEAAPAAPAAQAQSRPRRRKAPLITGVPPTVQCAPDQLSRSVPADDELHLVPEPPSASVAVLGLAGLAWVRRKKKAQL